MTEEELVERLLERGLADPGAATRALRATVSAFAECLMPEEAEAFARAFGGVLGERARRTLPVVKETLGAEDLYELVRKLDNVPPGLAREHAQIVLRVLADGLDPELRTRLVRTLPDDLAALLRAPSEGAPPEHTRPSQAPHLSTLATGRPGSRHPLSEAKPDRTQSHSVAKEGNPHGETKLSSARGMTQERLGDSMATGHPGPGRPISEVKDDEEGST